MKKSSSFVQNRASWDSNINVNYNIYEAIFYIGNSTY